jgi:cyclophilin family peptidyl-prolyl cis-trans isomerase
LTEKRKVSLLQVRIKEIEPELNKLMAEGNQNELNARINKIKTEVSAEVATLPPITFTEEQRTAYTTVGGYPSLDNNYTIFGEVIEGLDVLDKIASQTTDQFNRPLQDIKFRITMLK